MEEGRVRAIRALFFSPRLLPLSQEVIKGALEGLNKSIQGCAHLLWRPSVEGVP